MLRRAAFRFLLEKQPAKTIQSALADPDPVIRARAIYESHLRNKDQGYSVLQKALKEKNEDVAKLVLNCAKAIKDNKKSVELLQKIAKSSSFPKIRREAVRLVDFPYYREVKLLRNDPTHDAEVVTVKSIQLPVTGWSFRVDAAENGHHKGYFAPSFNDSKWRKLKVNIWWEKQGYLGYDGIAWYRIKFKVGKKIPGINAVEVHFGAVDEVAWVWLNGKYVGQHDEGVDGWNRAFDLDITKEIQYEAENTLVVRVFDTAAAGGIWKPVTINFLK
ncbi:MAG: beta galactosidase jelly roll domain-containing protein, partial [Lentisphaeria bacterium]|nr:beta galactosidase jelly roll domain-containing protein [Lentisphaeria bacterium]